MAPSDPSVPSEESDGIPAVRLRRRRSDQADGKNLPAAARSGGRPVRSRSTQPRACPLDRPDMPEARPSGQSRPRAIRSGGPWADSCMGVRHTIIRPSAPLPLSLFFSPLQFTLEWIRSSFGWTKSIHWPRPSTRSAEAVEPVGRGPRPSKQSTNESVRVGPSTPLCSLPTPSLTPPPPRNLPLSEFLKAFLFLEASQSFTIHIWKNIQHHYEFEECSEDFMRTHADIPFRNPCAQCSTFTPSYAFSFQGPEISIPSEKPNLRTKF